MCLHVKVYANQNLHPSEIPDIFNLDIDLHNRVKSINGQLESQGFINPLRSPDPHQLSTKAYTMLVPIFSKRGYVCNGTRE